MLLTKSIKLVMLISAQSGLGRGGAPGAGGPRAREFPSGPAAAPRRGGRYRRGSGGAGRPAGEVAEAAGLAAVPRATGASRREAPQRPAQRSRLAKRRAPSLRCGGETEARRRGGCGGVWARSGLPAGITVTSGTALFGLFACVVCFWFSFFFFLTVQAFTFAGRPLLRTASPVPTPLRVQRCP